MKLNRKDVIISGKNIELKKSIKQLISEKTDKLYHHEQHIIRIRVDIEYDPNRSKQNEYVAKGHIEIRGKDLIASAEADDVPQSVDKLVNTLDRLLRRRSRIRKTKRKNSQTIDIPANLPKAVSF